MSSHLQENFLGLFQRYFRVNTIELDVRSPGQQDEEESTCQNHGYHRQQTFERTERKPLHSLE